MIDWMKYRKIYFAISGVLILLSVYSLFNWRLKLGVDFTGGALAEYKIEGDFSTENISSTLKEKEIDVASVQNLGESKYLFKLPPLSQEQKDTLTKTLSEIVGEGKFEELRFENVGPAIGPELIKKTLNATFVASGAILLWIAIQFRSFKFGTSAVLAMFHDTFILVGVFSLFGFAFGTEIDFLFVTALLTTLSFSVHDTIVVYDRIRESQKKFGGNLKDLANNAITETMVRSLNNSFTIIFMLTALIILGGSTVKWFAVALLVGTVLGTYSSPFVAVPLLVLWDDIFKKLKK